MDVTSKQELTVNGMTCSHCAQTLTTVLSALSSVENVEVLRHVVSQYDAISRDGKFVVAAGYDYTRSTNDSYGDRCLADVSVFGAYA